MIVGAPTTVLRQKRSFDYRCQHNIPSACRIRGLHRRELGDSPPGTVRARTSAACPFLTIMRDTASLTVIAEQERDMDRRNFIGSMAPAVVGPCLFGAAGSAAGQSADTAMDTYSLAEGEARFGEETILFGSSANDIKVSGHDSQSRLAIFEYQGTVRGG